MYYAYFGLNQAPFKITPDTSLFFPGGNRGAVLNALIYAITSGEGIVKVVGEVGSGKTMLCRMLEVELPEKVEIVYLANPSLSPDDILHAIAFELKLPVTTQDNRIKVMNELQKYLLQRHSENRQVVMFIEEAQSMPVATLEEIRLLSNLETQQNKLLQIVLFGQPELDHMISMREIRQLKERITYSFYLKPFKPAEIRDYLNSRLRACGYRSGEVFTTSAIREIAHYSKGLLRRINILADKAMLAAYAANTHKVTGRHANMAARDSEFVAGWQRYQFAVITLGLMAITLISIWLFSLDQMRDKLTGDTPTATSDTLNHIEPEITTGEPLKESATIPAQENLSKTIYHKQDASRYYDYLSTGDALSLLVAEENNVESTPNVAMADGSKMLSVMNEDPGSITKDTSDVADSLRNRNYLAQAIERADSSLTSEEADWLVQQLHQLPPETGFETGDDVECRLCSLIIYRPIKRPENL
ncbi:MAG: AAA family ATPase [Gammaproteobacteria bacterium]|nr:AAA family ATPase [Gammaproteobacteria bacterium]